MKRKINYTDECRDTIIMCKNFKFPYIFLIIDKELNIAFDVKATLDLAEQVVGELNLKHEGRYMFEYIELK